MHRLLPTDSRRSPSTDYARDDRGVSEVLGSILIFALLLALLVIIQTAAVPAMNQQVEFTHNQRVQSDMAELGEQVDFTAARGAESSATVETGVYYPTRLFLLNPPPASGSLTTEPTSVTVSNARASGETGDYWDGSDRTFDSRRLVYSPNYNEYAAAPDTVYEGWALYNRHGNGVDTGLDSTSPVDDERIRLVALDGDRSTTTTAPVTVTTAPISVPERTVAVTDDGGPVTLSLSTDQSAAVWNETLAGETCTDADNDDRCDDPDAEGHVVDWTVGGGTLTIVLERGVTYELRTSKVGIAPGSTSEGPAYLTAVDAPASVDRTGTEMTVEVRDRFSTAESGVEVSFSATGASLSDATVTTDEDGRASVVAVPDADTSVTVVAEADLDGSGTIEARERVEFTGLPVDDGSGGEDTSELNPNDDDAVLLDNALIESTGGGNNRKYFVNVTLRNRADVDKSIEALRVNFYAASALGGRSGTEDLLHVAVGTKTMQVRDPYVYDLGLTPASIPANGGRASYDFEFRYDDGTENFRPLEGDFFIVSVIYDDGTTARYFIDPRNP